jgi:hypothetical protein
MSSRGFQNQSYSLGGHSIKDDPSGDFKRFNHLTDLVVFSDERVKNHDGKNSSAKKGERSRFPKSGFGSETSAARSKGMVENFRPGIGIALESHRGWISDS